MFIIYTANLITIKNSKILLVKRNDKQNEGGLWSLLAEPKSQRKP